MGTRSTTKVYNNDKMILALYCQFDGYPQGVGRQLADFIESRPFVNGIGRDDKVFNGMECFAAQLVAHLKTSAGLWYITGVEDESEEFSYTIRGGNDAANKPKPVTMTCEGYGKRFNGLPKDFAVWLETDYKTDES